ncbi:hypothetical protein EDB81DRAFT_374471 [Dactylonectria macrodidyma]|uniref:Ubiquitin-like protease family profile domain-containing protein n=1 Tax=Dactylonectria macrodidyma TaxID=307937 RepID=A0A9P9I841_9HYPO|nr:hypothetical protein EDB81DRAFT_374471 [Dactylonectria macrodidyma]
MMGSTPVLDSDYVSVTSRRPGQRRARIGFIHQHSWQQQDAVATTNIALNAMDKEGADQQQHHHGEADVPPTTRNTTLLTAVKVEVEDTAQVQVQHKVGGNGHDDDKSPLAAVDRHNDNDDDNTTVDDPNEPHSSLGKRKLKRFLSDLIDQSPRPTDGANLASFVQSRLRELQDKETQSRVLDKLPPQMPKIRAANQIAQMHRHNKNRSLLRREAHLRFLDEAWGGRQSWAPPDRLRNTDTLGINHITAIVSLTRAAQQGSVALADLWRPGGELYEAACKGHDGRLTKAKAVQAYNAVKARIGTAQAVDDSPGGPWLPPSENEDNNNSVDASPDASSELPSPEVGRHYSPSPFCRDLSGLLDDDDDDDDNISERCEIASLAHSEGLPVYLDFDATGNEVGRLHVLETQTLVPPLLPCASRTTTQNMPAISKAQQQLSDNMRLTDDVLELLARCVAQSSLTPAATILDPLWFTPDPEDNRMRTRLPRSVGQEDVYIPLHHSSGSPHWSLAVLSQHNGVLEHYDSLRCSHRDNAVKESFQIL